MTNVLLALLKAAKSVDGFGDHHPVIMNSVNGDVIAWDIIRPL